MRRRPRTPLFLRPDHDAVVRDLERLVAVGRLELSCDPEDLFIVLAALQLACRHPSMKGPTRERIVHFAGRIQQIFRQLLPDADALHQVCDLGWNRDADTQ